ncbi:MAG TPA: HNH endonuclease signature motif containing protein [Longimicrobiaceae bacterium]
MRPITRRNPQAVGNLAEYPFYTPQSLQQQNETFGATSVTAQVYNNGVMPVTRTVEEIQADLLTFLLGGNPFHALSQPADRTRAAKAMKERLAEIYRPANAHLTLQFGNYCSYCEIAIPGHLLHVEHLIPKSQFPLRTVWWDNFLQACPNCNSSKGQNPLRTTALGWVPTPIINPTETDIMDAAVDRYFWPDRNADSYHRLSYQLCDAANGYAVIPLAAASDTTNTPVSFVNYQVHANVLLNNLPGSIRVLDHWVEVTVVPAGNPAGQLPATDDQLLNVGLNVQGSSRAGYRTQTWFRVLTQLQELEQALGTFQPPQHALVFPILWNAFLLAFQAFGHYSTILTILADFNDVTFMNPAYNSLGDRFVNDTAPANAGPLTVFPGTNRNLLP